MESEKRFSLQKSEICSKVFTDKSNEWDKGRILTSYLARRAKHLSLLRSPALLACFGLLVSAVQCHVSQAHCHHCLQLNDDATAAAAAAATIVVCLNTEPALRNFQVTIFCCWVKWSPKLVSDCLGRGFSILMYCDLLTKSWFPN